MKTDIKPIYKELKSRGMTLSVAESCTGGLVGHLITQEPGISDVFKGGVIAYSNDIKRAILGVSHKTLLKHGAVSRQCAIEMAKAVRIVTKSDIALSTTGNLGPSALEDKDVGVVHMAVTNGKKTLDESLKLKGNRSQNKTAAANKAINLLRKFLNQ